MVDGAAETINAIAIAARAARFILGMVWISRFGMLLEKREGYILTMCGWYVSSMIVASLESLFSCRARTVPITARLPPPLHTRAPTTTNKIFGVVDVIASYLRIVVHSTNYVPTTLTGWDGGNIPLGTQLKQSAV